MALWATQILLALVFGAAGAMKLARSKAQLAANPHLGWVQSVPEAQIKLLAAAELLGAIGLIAPTATGIAPLLARAAAAGLAALMGGAVATHMNRQEPAAVPATLAVLAIVVATLR